LAAEDHSSVTTFKYFWVFTHIREEYHISKRNIKHKKRNSSHREKNSTATDKGNHLLQKIILLSLHPLQQRIRFLGVWVLCPVYEKQHKFDGTNYPEIGFLFFSKNP
jgi:hypothetical protein